MVLGITQSLSNFTNIGLVGIVGIQAPRGTFGNFEQSPAMSRLVNVTIKFAMAQSASTAASGIKRAIPRHAALRCKPIQAAS